MRHKKRVTREQGLTEVVERNIATLLQRQCADKRRKTVEEKVADAITRFTGSMRFVYLQAHDPNWRN